MGQICQMNRKRKLRIQGGMQTFRKNMSQKGLNHELRPELESRGKMLQIPLTNPGFWCFLRRAVIILLQKKNFGLNVIYCVCHKSPVSRSRRRRLGRQIDQYRALRRPTGAFWAEEMIKLVLKSTRRRLLG